MKKTLTILMLIISAFCLQAKVIHVDPNSSTSDPDGSISRPYKTWPLAFSKAISGDEITFSKGTTTVAGNFVFNRQLSNITISSYGFGNNPVLLSNSTNNATKVFDIGARVTNLTISGVDITSQTGNVTTLIYLCRGSDGFTVQDSKLYNSQWGIRLYSTEAAPYDGIKNVMIRNVDIFNTKDDGLYFYKTFKYSLINVFIYDVNQNWHPGAPQEQAAGDCAQIVWGNQATFENCRFYRNTTANKFCLIISYTTPCPNNYISITGCTFLSPQTSQWGGAAVYFSTNINCNIEFHFNNVIGDRMTGVEGLTGVHYQASTGTLNSSGNVYMNCNRAISHLSTTNTKLRTTDDYFIHNQIALPATAIRIGGLIVN